MVVAGATLAARGALGRRPTAHGPRPHESCRSTTSARGERALDRRAAGAPDPAARTRELCDQRVRGAQGCSRDHLLARRGRSREDRRHVRTNPHRRATNALGLVLAPSHALLQLAIGTRAARGARLRGGARALPPASPEPLTEVLGTRRGAPTALA